jgi:hypothetical protein
MFRLKRLTTGGIEDRLQAGLLEDGIHHQYL